MPSARVTDSTERRTSTAASDTPRIYTPLTDATKVHAASDKTWYMGTMQEGYGYSAMGLAPDQYEIESWVGAPSHADPYTDPLSFTGTVLAFVRQFVAPHLRPYDQ